MPILHLLRKALLFNSSTRNESSFKTNCSVVVNTLFRPPTKVTVRKRCYCYVPKNGHQTAMFQCCVK